MYILVTYDVQTDTTEGQRRLKKVAKLCMNYGQRVQNSVFECVIDDANLAILKSSLTEVMDTKNDSICIYFLNKNQNKRIIRIGKDRSIDVEGALVI